MTMVNQSSVFTAVLGVLVLFALQPTNARSEILELQSRGDVEIVRGTEIELRPLEDRPIYAEIMPDLQSYLSDRGLRTTSRGAMILRFGYQTTGKIETLGDPNFSIAGRTGTGGSSNMQMTLRFRQESSSRSNRKLIMTFELYRPGSPPLWTARVLGPDSRSNKNYLLSEMSKLAIQNIGKSAYLKQHSE